MYIKKKKLVLSEIQEISSVRCVKKSARHFSQFDRQINCKHIFIILFY